MTQTNRGAYTPYLCFLCFLCVLHIRNIKNITVSVTLRGFRHSAAGKSNAAMGVHGGDAGDGIRRGHVRFQLHDSTKNPIAIKTLHKGIYKVMPAGGGL